MNGIGTGVLSMYSAWAAVAMACKGHGLAWCFYLAVAVVFMLLTCFYRMEGVGIDHD
jgi:hypothetical protein